MLINTVDYTPLELILAGVGACFWVTVYVITIINIRKYKYVEMPFFCACGNIVWEFLWGFFFYERINMGELYIWSYRVWFLADIYIFISLWRYGYKQFDLSVLRKHAHAIIVGLTLAFTAIITAFVVSELDNPMGAQTSYLLNFGISTLYILHWLRLRKSQYYSRSIAWAKMLGTLMYSIYFRLAFPDNYAVLALSIVIFLLDNLYLWLLYNYKDDADSPAAAVV